MKSPLFLILAALLFFSDGGFAQASHPDSLRRGVDSVGLHNDSTKLTDTTKAGISGATADVDADEWNPGLFFFLLIFAGIIGGAAVVGSMTAVLLLLALFLMASAGILSAGVLVGFYRRSVTAGFRTIVYLACTLGGIAFGVGVLLLANHFLHWYLGYKNILLIGTGGGLLGGFLLGFVVIGLVKVVLRYLKDRLAL